MEERMKTHKLKILPEYYQEVVAGNKKAEIRVHDREYEVGDYVILKEWDIKGLCYTGDSCIVEITHVVNDFRGLAPGFCMFSFDF
jgi:ASC-1-like (ASCH) protein